MERKQIPAWVKKRVSVNDNYRMTRSLIRDLSLNTVCEGAVCPNIYECFCKKYATFMILGSLCTRNCRFCGVERLPLKKGMPVDHEEPARIAMAVKRMGMKYAVITSPTRDDLPDRGASHFAAVTEEIRKADPSVKVEILVPDFGGRKDLLRIALSSGPDMVAHNIETVERLYPSVRPSSSYRVSMSVLRLIHDEGFPSKSGFMLGIGEKEAEVIDLMSQIRETGCDYLVIGQYLMPSSNALDVKEYMRPEIFDRYRETGMAMGFRNVFSGTFCRSSYMAEQLAS